MTGMAKIPLVLSLTLMIVSLVVASKLAQTNQNPQRKAAEEATPTASASASPRPSSLPIR